jgi:hypothetical protein
VATEKRVPPQTAVIPNHLAQAATVALPGFTGPNIGEPGRLTMDFMQDFKDSQQLDSSMTTQHTRGILLPMLINKGGGYRQSLELS